MLRPVSSSRICALDLGGRALQEELLEHAGRLALRRDRDAGARPRQAAAPPLTASVSDGNRVSVPIRSATSWSSEIVLRNELLAGCGAAVRKQMSDGWPPSTFGCDTPLSTVKSSRCSFEELQVRRGRVVAAGVRGEERLRQHAEVVADAEHPPRAGGLSPTVRIEAGTQRNRHGQPRRSRARKPPR